MTTLLEAVRQLFDIMPRLEALTGCTASLMDENTIEIKVSFTGCNNRFVCLLHHLAETQK